MRRTSLHLAAVAIVLGPGVLWSQTVDHSAHSGHAMGAGASTPAFEAALARMHGDMAIPYTGDADIDFVRGMIPHHQGAVEMARIVLEHGKDPQLRALAEAIIAAQEKEIAWMQDWLAKHGQ